jgi:hypothetical protein
MKTVLLLIGFVLANIHLAEAQKTKKMPRVGFLPSPVRPKKHKLERLDGFRQGLLQLCYVGGQKIKLELRWAEDKLDQVPILIAELIRLKRRWHRHSRASRSSRCQRGNQHYPGGNCAHGRCGFSRGSWQASPTGRKHHWSVVSDWRGQGKITRAAEGSSSAAFTRSGSVG